MISTRSSAAEGIVEQAEAQHEGGVYGVGEADAAFEVLRSHPDIAQATPPQASPDGQVHTSLAFPTTGPQDHETSELVKSLREDLGDPYLVGGQTAANVDFSQAIADRFPVFVAIVLLIGVVRRDRPLRWEPELRGSAVVAVVVLASAGLGFVREYKARSASDALIQSVELAEAVEVPGTRSGLAMAPSYSASPTSTAPPSWQNFAT